MVQGWGPRPWTTCRGRGAWKPGPAPPSGPPSPPSVGAAPPPLHPLIGCWGWWGRPASGCSSGERPGAQNRNRSRPQRRGQTVVVCRWPRALRFGPHPRAAPSTLECVSRRVVERPSSTEGSLGTRAWWRALEDTVTWARAL